MNERIKRLLAQAHVEAKRPNDTNWIASRFAELIVRECLRVIQMESREYSGPGCEDGLLIAQGAIREHFGVEDE